jgi:hypothetical protein
MRPEKKLPYMVEKGYAIMGLWRNSGKGFLRHIRYVLVGKGFLTWGDDIRGWYYY